MKHTAKQFHLQVIILVCLKHCFSNLNIQASLNCSNLPLTPTQITMLHTA